MKDKKAVLQNTAVVCVLATVCCALWGSAFPFIKIGYEKFGISSGGAFSQILFAGVRFTLSGIITLFFSSLFSKRFVYPSKREIPKVLKLSMFQTVLQYLFFYLGLARTTGVKASVLDGANVFIAFIVTCLVFRMERFTAKKLIGSIVGFVGVVLINMSGLSFDFNFTGDGFILISAVAYAMSSVFMKRYTSDGTSPIMLSGWQFLSGGIIMTVIGFIGGGRIYPSGGYAWAVLLYLAALSAAAYGLWSVLLNYNLVSKVAVFGFMNPIFGVIFSSLLLDEQNGLGFTALAALIFVCAGILIVNIKTKREKNN